MGQSRMYFIHDVLAQKTGRWKDQSCPFWNQVTSSQGGGWGAVSVWFSGIVPCPAWLCGKACVHGWVLLENHSRSWAIVSLSQDGPGCWWLKTWSTGLELSPDPSQSHSIPRWDPKHALLVTVRHAHSVRVSRFNSQSHENTNHTYISKNKLNLSSIYLVKW